MMNKSKSLLIISYTFPPVNGIGGRRWAKFVKQLARMGYNIHVISVQPSTVSKSEWDKDLIDISFQQHYIPVLYPNVISGSPDTIFRKLLYRAWLAFFKIYSKGSLYDRAMFWEKHLITKANKVISEYQVKNMIVTIPPFSLARFSLLIKKNNPKLNFVVDYRDPWTDNKSFHGFKDLKPSRLKYETEIENEVLKCADHIITVSSEMTQKLISRNVTNQNKFHTVQNGFDADDLIKTELPGHTKDEKINFIYAGSLYNNLEYVILPFLKELVRLKTNDVFTYKKLQFEFYGNQDVTLVNLINSYNLECIKLYGQISLQKIHEKIRNSDFCLLFSAPDHAFAFNTKFFEYMSFRKPILLFSNEGKTSEFIKQHNLGKVIEPLHFDKSFTQFIGDVKSRNFKFNDKFNIDPYSVQSLVQEIDKLLI